MVKTLAERMTDRGVHGLSLAVITQGRLARAEGYGLLEAGTERRTQPHHRFHACSISKMVTAITALTLVQDDVIGLDTDVNQYLRAWRLPGEGVTLRHLLSHQAGIVDADGCFECLRPGEAHPTLLQILNGESRIHPGPVGATLPPGAQFAYSDAGFCVVEQLLTEVTGQPFADLVRQRVLQPLGLAHTMVATAIAPRYEADVACGHDQSGQVIPGRRPVYPFQGPAGLWSSASDLAQVALELMAAMRGQGRLLDRATAEAMTSPPWHPRIGLGIFLDDLPANQPWYYHYGWGVGFQGALSFSPALQSGLVILMNAEPGVPQWRSLIGEVAGLVAAEMGWPRSPTPTLA